MGEKKLTDVTCIFVLKFSQKSYSKTIKHRSMLLSAIRANNNTNTTSKNDTKIRGTIDVVNASTRDRKVVNEGYGLAPLWPQVTQG